ncbi:hypothetical protein [Pelosinus sp. IPA-1]|uniref:hypothetical protein n=1 Tax=Pelosinus sp. IPA-1 TaxID=3029569 RepID=UPI0024362142|nr:hypothetical protein [Pelosinus sp. IPA-1]GMB02054.1 hypothetical protein PIPA1_48540 [Pelosinus sp. IPA-1]
MEKILQQLLEGQKQLLEGQQELKQSILRFEQAQNIITSALFDTAERQIDDNQRILATLNRLESKIDRISLKVSDARHNPLLQTTATTYSSDFLHEGLKILNTRLFNQEAKMLNLEKTK